MGGAGGTVYETPRRSRTGAYLASRVARDVVERADARPARPGMEPRRRSCGRGPASLSQRRSSTSRELKAPPERSAVQTAARAADHHGAGRPATPRVGGSTWACHVLWAGDSRAYVVRAGTARASSPPTTCATPVTPWRTCGGTRWSATPCRPTPTSSSTTARSSCPHRSWWSCATDGCFGTCPHADALRAPGAEPRCGRPAASTAGPALQAESRRSPATTPRWRSWVSAPTTRSSRRCSRRAPRSWSERWVAPLDDSVTDRCAPSANCRQLQRRHVESVAEVWGTATSRRLRALSCSGSVTEDVNEEQLEGPEPEPAGDILPVQGRGRTVRREGRRRHQRLHAPRGLQGRRRRAQQVDLRRAGRPGVLHQGVPQPTYPDDTPRQREDQGGEAGAMRRLRGPPPGHPRPSRRCPLRREPHRHARLLPRGAKYYKVTEKVDPARLERRRRRRLDFRAALVLLKTVAHSLRILHDLGIVHSDLKPSNVLIKRTELGYTTKLIDFDSSYIAGSPPPPEEIVGTINYYSPELLGYIQEAGVAPTHLGVVRRLRARPDLHRVPHRRAAALRCGDYHEPAVAVRSGETLRIPRTAIAPELADLVDHMLPPTPPTGRRSARSTPPSWRSAPPQTWRAPSADRLQRHSAARVCGTCFRPTTDSTPSGTGLVGKLLHKLTDRPAR